MLGYKKLESVLDGLARDEQQRRREARVQAQLDEVRAVLAQLDGDGASETAAQLGTGTGKPA